MMMFCRRLMRVYHWNFFRLYEFTMYAQQIHTNPYSRFLSFLKNAIEPLKYIAAVICAYFNSVCSCYN